MNKAFEIILSWLHKRLDFHENRMAELGGTERDVEDWGSVKAYSDAIDIVEKVAEEYNGGWVPCSERLPEEAFGCLVTVIDCEPVTQNEFENILPYFVGYDGRGWIDSDGEEIPFEVIAWQPIPEPYTEK